MGLPIAFFEVVSINHTSGHRRSTVSCSTGTWPLIRRGADMVW
jgi:hypothetical protein